MEIVNAMVSQKGCLLDSAEAQAVLPQSDHSELELQLPELPPSAPTPGGPDLAAAANPKFIREQCQG